MDMDSKAKKGKGEVESCWSFEEHQDKIFITRNDMTWHIRNTD